MSLSPFLTSPFVFSCAGPSPSPSPPSSDNPNTGGAVVCSPACESPTPICSAEGTCTDVKWVEPIDTLPARWRGGIDTGVWTKWVRSILPIVGQELTEDAALLEVAYFAEHVLYPGGEYLRDALLESMLGAEHPTRFSVYPACPNAWMHPGVEPAMSSGGGGWRNTMVSEDWVLRYPKCTGDLAVACDKIPLGTRCNNCQWQNSNELETCRDTLAHEWGHTGASPHTHTHLSLVPSRTYI